MARIVPAKPRAGAPPAESAALLALERGLTDDWVVFQRRPLPGMLLAANPERGLCLVACHEGPTSFDADSEEWDSPLLHDALKRAREPALPGIPACVVAFLPGATGPGAQEGVAALADPAALAAVVLQACPPGRVLSQEAMDSLISSASPGATPYARGTVTVAQEKWRAEGGRAPEPAPAPAMAAPPPEITSQAPEPVYAVEQAEVVMARADEPPMSLDDPVMLMLRQAVESAAGGRKVRVMGIWIDLDEAVSPEFMLPALAMSAAEEWAPVVAGSGGQGGFRLRLQTDKKAILGYRVVGMDLSSPLLVVLPIVHRIRTSAVQNHNGQDTIDLDGVLHRFARWLKKHGLDTSVIGEADMRIALAV